MNNGKEKWTKQNGGNKFIMNEKCQRTTGGLAKLGGKVIIRFSVRPLTVSDNPNGVQSIPNFAKPPGRWLQCGESAVVDPTVLWKMFNVKTREKFVI